MKEKFGVIEIRNNTKTHIYEDNDVIYESNTTIEFKKNYNTKILSSDLDKLYEVIEKSLEYTSNIHIYGCSIFRKLSNEELNDINKILYDKYKLKVEVVSQEDEAYYTAFGCYSDIDFNKNICVFIGGGGSIELVFVSDKKVIDRKYYNFGNAKYELLNNELYSNEKQKYMITRDMSDKYDRNALITSLDEIRKNSDNPKWFDGARAMKIITNLVSHKINAKYIIPTKINMEDGLRNKLNS